MLRSWYRRLRGNYWRPVYCCGFHPEGWATYNKARNMFLDQGLSTKQHAQWLCDIENLKEGGPHGPK